MDKLRAIKLFVRAVDAGSFTAVADELNVTTSMISKEIRRLEEELGVRLLHRSTRGQQLTAIGEGYLQRCRELLITMEDTDAYVQHMQSNPKGKLRINAPMALGITDLPRMFSAYMKAYPNIELDIHLGDESQDLIEHGFDRECMKFCVLSHDSNPRRIPWQDATIPRLMTNWSTSCWRAASTVPLCWATMV